MHQGQRNETVSAAEVRRATRDHARRSLTQEQSEQLALYLSCLLRWNQRMNLVSAADWKTLLIKLILDSVFLAELLDEVGPVPEPRILDVGAGAGLPGIPYRILRQAGSYVMLEPRGKRHSFLRFVLSQLRLPDTEAVQARLEDLSPDSNRAEVLLGRGTARWQRFLRLVAPYCMPEGIAVVFSGTPFPRGESPPEGWYLLRETPYQTSPDLAPRYFWSFCPKKAPS